MLRGYFDALMSAGYIHGWAYDTEAPEIPLRVAVFDGDAREVASGVAHHYRDDLVAAGCGTGWCEFRLRVESVTRLRHRPLILVDAGSGAEIARTEKVPYIESGDVDIRSIEALIVSDPTMAHTVDQLGGCRDLFQRFILQRGVEAFVRAAYVYVLGRPADPGGLKRYGRLMRTGGVEPFELLQILADSEEFRSRPRLLGAPNSSSFALACR